MSFIVCKDSKVYAIKKGNNQPEHSLLTELLDKEIDTVACTHNLHIFGSLRPFHSKTQNFYKFSENYTKILPFPFEFDTSRSVVNFYCSSNTFFFLLDDGTLLSNGSDGNGAQGNFFIKKNIFFFFFFFLFFFFFSYFSYFSFIKKFLKRNFSFFFNQKILFN